MTTNDAARMFTAKQSKSFGPNGRKKLAGTAALPDGSFPIVTKADLKNAIQAFGRAKNKAVAKAHIIKRARSLNATDMLPDGWVQKKTDKADDMTGLITCPADGCERAFLDEDSMLDHADSVHTYDEIQQKVNNAVKAKFGRPATATSPGNWVWVADLTDTWVVFSMDQDEDGVPGLFQADYTIDADGNVTLSEPKPVERKTVYVPASKAD